MNTSFPVHPTQLYESLVGLVLLVLLLWQRKYTRFRGQVFFLFVFAYGFLRFLLEIWRDDVERGSYGPTLDEHVYIPLCLLLMALGLRLRHLARASRTSARDGRPRARVRAAGRGVPRAAAGELRADACLTSSRRASSSACCSAPVGVVLLRALLGRRAQEPAPGDEPRRRGQHPAPARARPKKRPSGRERGRRRGRARDDLTARAEDRPRAR